jgi:hypothetical protein
MVSNSTTSNTSSSDPEVLWTILTTSGICNGGPSDVYQDMMDNYWSVPDICHSILTSSYCAWRDGLGYINTPVSRIYETPTTIYMRSVETSQTTAEFVERHLLTETVMIPGSLLTTITRFMTYLDIYPFYDGRPWSSNTFTFTPHEGCCGQCTMSGGSVQVYFWPNARTTPPVSELIDSQNDTL